jgi:hypothetical protein
MLLSKVAMINDYISLYENQVMSGRIDERNATGQNVLYQIRLMETVNKNRNLVDMDDLRCNRKQDGNRKKKRKNDEETILRENKQITTAATLAGCWQEQIIKLVVVYIFLSGRRRW